MIQNRLWEKIQEQIDMIRKTQYDEENGLLQYEAKGINYHTGISYGAVHSTRENLGWLPALLKRGRKEDNEIAFATIPKVLALQDKVEESETYGIWPYLFEEPISKMKNPDWNWAPFLGATLVTLLKEYRSILPVDIVPSMEEALVRACESIIRRNVGVDYTNISLMSTFVLVLTGELLEKETFYQRGLETLKAQLEFVELNGGFAEYNSPTYGVINIEETGRLLKYSKQEEVKEVAKRLHELSWKAFAEHYHPAMGQIAPPHARCYQDIQGSEIRTLITIGTGGKCELEAYENWQVSAMWPFMTLECPKYLWKYFESANASRVIEEEFYKGIDTIKDEEIRVIIEKGTPSLTSYTYFHPQYCLGTFKKHDMWNQRRPLMAYFATDQGVACFRIRCMHDDMDFAGGIISTIQQKGAVIGSVGFVTDHGDYHYILTPIVDGKIIASQISLDFVVEGVIEEVRVSPLYKEDQDDEMWCFEIGSSLLYLKVLSAVFGKEKVRIELIDTGSSKGIKIVLFDGENRELDLKHLEQAYVAFWIEIVERKEELTSKGLIRREEEKLICSLSSDTGDCKEIEIMQKPGLYMPSLSGLTKEFKFGGFRYHE